MPDVAIPISQLPVADLPLTGDELIVVVQDGLTKQSDVADSVASPIFGSEAVVVLPAGQSNNVPVPAMRMLIDTTVGDISISGFDSTGVPSGRPLFVTNTGSVNLLTLLNANAGSLAQNRNYGPADLALPPGTTGMLIRSGLLLRWMMVP